MTRRLNTSAGTAQNSVRTDTIRPVLKMLCRKTSRVWIIHNSLLKEEN